MAFVISPKLAAIFIIVLPVLAVLIVVIMRRAFPQFRTLQGKLDALNSCIQEGLVGIRLIKSFVRGDYEEMRFEKRNQQLKEANLTAMKTMLLYTPLMTLALNITTVVVVWSGGNMIVAGNMQVGDLTAFTNYIVQIMSSLTMLSIAFLNWARAIASFRRVGEVLDEKIDLTDENAKHKDRAVCEGSVEFQNVSFRYYKNSPEWVIENISFKLEAGKTLGIIGPTGSGKSTLVSMIPRLYDTDEGTVLVDGINVRDYGLKPLREGIGMVLQNNTLFSGSITENLKWGDEHADEKAVRKAAQNAQAAGFIDSFKDGYRTRLEQSGNNVSGGQKQRLCIARALLKCPKILILDDSTSAVDTATERAIREALHSEYKDMTKIIIAQRIRSVMDADEILVLDNGKTAGFGTHEQLLADCPVYREIYDVQNGREE